jgi:hypothetical protein
VGLNPKAYPDIWGVDFARINVVHDFVGGEECHGVRIVLECLYYAEYSCQVVIGVRGPWLNAVDAGFGRVDVDDHIDTSCIEYTRALIVVRCGVDIVDANSVDLCHCRQSCSFSQPLSDIHQASAAGQHLVSTRCHSRGHPPSLQGCSQLVHQVDN